METEIVKAYHEEYFTYGKNTQCIVNIRINTLHNLLYTTQITSKESKIRGIIKNKVQYILPKKDRIKLGLMW